MIAAHTAIRGGARGGQQLAPALRRLHTRSSKFLKVSDEVREAVNAGKPIVALETTIYTHGFPYPKNIELSKQLESLVRQNGAVPASIGVLNGVAQVGMSTQDMVELLDKASQGWQTVKLSRRDLGWICGQGLLGKDVNGGTTIAGTMVLSHLAGIKVFATGGLGGVHKGGEVSMDVSADLTELGRTPVALVSSGCKSFLDIPRTLEYLETQGAGVGTFADGREGPVNFPAFWTRDSGTPSPRTIKDEREAAAIIHAQFGLPLSSGLFFANPISEEYSLSREHMDEVMNQAVLDAADAGALGHENTPFVLNRISEITKGSTLTANRELVAANVVRGARVAVELAALDNDKSAASYYLPAQEAHAATQNKIGKLSEHVDVVVAGSLALDISGDYVGERAQMTPYTSNPGKFSEGIGGVGRNIALAASLSGASVRFCSVVGEDSAGRHLLDGVRRVGLSGDSIHLLPGHSSGRYVALNDGNKDLFTAMADMNIIESTEARFNELWEPVLTNTSAKWLAIDANWDAKTLQKWIAKARSGDIAVAYEPVSEEKSSRIFQELGPTQLNSIEGPLIDLATPNAAELKAMKNALLLSANSQKTSAEWSDSFDISNVSAKLDVSDASVDWVSTLDILSDALYVIRRVGSLLITLGKRGVLLVQNTSQKNIVGDHVQNKDGSLLEGFTVSDGSHDVYIKHLPVPLPVDEAEIISVNGVGDTFFGVVLAGLAAGRPLDEDLIRTAQTAAAFTLRSRESVSPEVLALQKSLKAPTS